MTKPIPEGYHTITPYLAVEGADEAIEFYKRAFGAIEIIGDRRTLTVPGSFYPLEATEALASEVTHRIVEMGLYAPSG